ncbi:MAG: hypothetical protein ABR508_08855 [Candidatus Baltobacteraceae bacterium]
MTNGERIWERIKALSTNVADGSLSAAYVDAALFRAIASETHEPVPADALNFYRHELHRLAALQRMLEPA